MNTRKIITIVNRRLSNIDRYNNTPRVRYESVAEHSYFVAFYAMMLSGLVLGINREQVMKLALVHDVEEAVSGDILHTVKMKHKRLEESLEEMNYLIALEIFGEEDSEYLKLWCESRDFDTLEARLVQFCDKLSVYLYTSDEVSMGNTFMKEINERVLVALNSMLDAEPKFYRIREELAL